MTAAIDNWMDLLRDHGDQVSEANQQTQRSRATMYIEGIKEIEGSSAVGAELEERTYITLLNGDTVILECSVINYINIYFQKGNNKIVCAEIDTMARKEEEEPTDV